MKSLLTVILVSLFITLTLTSEDYSMISNGTTDFKVLKAAASPFDNKVLALWDTRSTIYGVPGVTFKQIVLLNEVGDFMQIVEDNST